MNAILNCVKNWGTGNKISSRRGGNPRNKVCKMEFLEERNLLSAIPLHLNTEIAESTYSSEYYAEEIRADYSISGLEDSVVMQTSDDPDPIPTVQFVWDGTVNSCTEGESVTLTLTRDITIESLTVYYCQDYTYGPNVAEAQDVINPGTFETPRSVTFAAGQSTTTITIQTVDDNYVEANWECYYVRLVSDMDYTDYPDYYTGTNYLQNVHVIDNDAWIISVSQVGNSIIESASIGGDKYEGYTTWDSDTTYPKFVLTRTGMVDPDDDYQVSCSVNISVSSQYDDMQWGGNNYTLHIKNEDGEYESGLNTSYPISWWWEDSNTMEIYLNPYVGPEEADQTVTLTINPSDDYYATSGLQNYVVGTNSSAQIRIINDEKPEIDTASYGVTTTLAEIFHDANDDDEEIIINLEDYFDDEETPNDLTYSVSFWSSYNVIDTERTVIDSDNKLHIYFQDGEWSSVGYNEIHITATDPANQTVTWIINVYSDRVNGYSIQEKSHEMGYWDWVDDSGTDWALLWKENAYKLKPNLQNYSTSNVISVDWEYTSWSNRGAGSGESIGTTTWDTVQNQWEYFENGLTWSFPNTGTLNEIALLPTVTLASTQPTLFTHSATLEMDWGTSPNLLVASGTAPRIGVTGIQSVEWEAITGNAELSNNPTSSIGGKRIFPEKDLSGTLQNKVNVKVTLEKDIPTGMTGNVYLAFFDPMNQCFDSRGAKVGVIGDWMNGRNDNHGSGFLESTTLMFTSTDNRVKRSAFTISSAYAGDNYIVVALPSSTVAQDTFIYANTTDGTNDYKTIMRRIENGNEELDDAHQTELLTVWRTLWLEVERIYDTIGAQLAPDLDLTSSSYSWAVTEMRYACIEIKICSCNDEDGWKVNMPGNKAELSTNYEETYNTTTLRNYPNSEDFWVVQTIMGFSCSLSGGDYYVNGQAYMNSVILFTNEFTGVGWKKGGKVLLHELGHAFSLPDNEEDNNSLMFSGMVTDENGTVRTWNYIDAYLTNDYIRVIQSKNKPILVVRSNENE
ncbi:MAG: hypothetical protein Q4C70_01710 [Planctomycetia bacterium]|nr:hypothetical protein [Planctomycetia bacterium]